MNDKALLLIDLQIDFFHGSMKVPKASEIIIPIKQLIREYRLSKNLIVRTGDLHPPNHCSFRENGGLWPKHCCKDNTKSGHGHHYYTQYGLRLHGSKNQFWKGQSPNIEQYSGFDAIHKDGTKLHEFLTMQYVKELLIVGLALDYCVSETAIEFASHGWKTSAYLPATRAVKPENSFKAISNMQKAGVIILN